MIGIDTFNWSNQPKNTIGINAVIVGKITIGDDVLIAPNCFVNCDIPPHSVVFGNPCVIKHRDCATEGYINNILCK